MQLYPHWLDGEFVRIASKVDGEKQTIGALTRALKLHALLGTEFVLSDVQVFDSAAVLELFADPEFRKFVEKNRSFLDLRVEPDLSLGSTPFALAARGLTRTIQDGWISSAFFGNDTPIKRLADEIINEIQNTGYIQPGWTGDAERAHPAFAERLSAVRHAICYFGMHDAPEELEAPIGERSNYYQVLKESLDALQTRVEQHDAMPERHTPYGRHWLAQTHTDMTNIGDVIDFIDKHIPDEAYRKFRSKVLAILRGQQILNEEKGILIWNNVVQAWSYATERTIQPDGGSSGMLLGAVSPAPILDRQMDVLVPVYLDGSTQSLNCIEDLPVLQIDLNRITWTEVAVARAETADTLVALAIARAKVPQDIEAISEEFRKHITKLGETLVKPNHKSAVSYACKIAGVTIAWFGYPPGAALAGLKLVDDFYTDAGYKARNALVNTLRNACGPRPK